MLLTEPTPLVMHLHATTRAQRFNIRFNSTRSQLPHAICSDLRTWASGVVLRLMKPTWAPDVAPFIPNLLINIRGRGQTVELLLR